MPPGKGFYGPKIREKRSERRLAPMALLAGVPVLALFAWVGMCTMGGGSSPEPGGAALTGDSQPQVKPTELPKVAPTRDPAKKVAGENEGSGTLLFNPEKPNISEYLIAGGKRFKLPLSAHAGVEDYFGSARADGKIHTGVDFSLTGLKNVPVEAGCDGFVTDATTDDAVYGTHVTIDCGGNFTVILGWLQSVRVAKGNNVSKTTVVGTGETDGFVHVELRYKGVPFDPKDFMQIPGKEVIPWTPTPTPTLKPGETPTPEPTDTPVPVPTQPNGGSGGSSGSGGSGPTQAPPPPTDTPTLGPPTSTPTITPTPTRTPFPTKTPVPPKNTPTPLPKAY
jgi:murein DD-endopeptidase MepM/ murein hydrolase activator NlpD